jgi:hypothetical protein
MAGAETPAIFVSVWQSREKLLDRGHRDHALAANVAAIEQSIAAQLIELRPANTDHLAGKPQINHVEVNHKLIVGVRPHRKEAEPFLRITHSNSPFQRTYSG